MSEKKTYTIRRKYGWDVYSYHVGWKEIELTEEQIAEVRANPDLLDDDEWLDKAFDWVDMDEEELVTDSWCKGGVDQIPLETEIDFYIEDLTGEEDESEDQG
jgi:hypothetical protein